MFAAFWNGLIFGEVDGCRYGTRRQLCWDCSTTKKTTP